MKWDHIIRGGEIVTPTSQYKANIYVKNGKIVTITDSELEGEAKEITDATGLQVLPGLIDTHVHSRDGGATYKEDFFHSTQAAAAGGITTIFEMPNTNPTINNVENFHKQVENLHSKAHVNFGVWGICLGDINNEDLQSLSEAGVIGFKYFWGYAVNKHTFQLVYNYSNEMEDVFPPCDDGEVFAMFEEVAKTGQTFAIHAENSDVINRLTKSFEKSGKTDYETFLASRPNVVEELTIQTAISMAKQTGAKLHILHVSTAEGVHLIRQAQKEGIPITAETCPHYLFLTNKDYETIGPSMKVYPLVKFQKDQDSIWEGIADGTISFVCSDHAPHTEEEKNGDLWTIPAGMCGVETIAPLMLNAVSEKRITLQQFVSLLAENPAKQFGVFPQKGAIQVGSDADLTIVDMKKQAVIKKEQLHSKSKVTAYDGYKVTGMPVVTIVNGVTVMKNGEVTGGILGKLVIPTK
ncbi:allantoinase AllB [Pseudogracilibacillus auburnensis]|uniref:allantoinase AllB n=1 Tax=Pseudogracilibacillus auburnensis TaxID=1494959 RepID=UPI001A974EAD|nr:allantoinase AllB [Pseudogracilibacillus auburnensis]MBO1003843.1 allantoinase AllB [Pseudogracilibacillus auburnensis]